MGEDIERLEAKIKKWHSIALIEAEITALKKIKDRLEEQEGYESTDEWTEARLDIQGRYLEIALLKEEEDFDEYAM